MPHSPLRFPALLGVCLLVPLAARAVPAPSAAVASSSHVLVDVTPWGPGARTTLRLDVDGQLRGWESVPFEVRRVAGARLTDAETAHLLDLAARVPGTGALDPDAPDGDVWLVVDRRAGIDRVGRFREPTAPAAARRFVAAMRERWTAAGAEESVPRRWIRAEPVPPARREELIARGASAAAPSDFAPGIRSALTLAARDPWSFVALPDLEDAAAASLPPGERFLALDDSTWMQFAVWMQSPRPSVADSPGGP